MPKMLLSKLGGTNLENLGDRTAVSEDHTLTWEKMLEASMKGPAEQANKTLKAVGSYDNKDFTFADNFTLAEGIKDTVITDINPDNFSEHVIIEAADVTVANFNLFNCKCVQIDTGKWVLFSNSSDAETRRAEIYATLFYGSNSTNGRVLNSITGLTALKTSISRDVGKQAHIGRMTHTDGSVGNRSQNNFYYNANFVNTTTNNDCSAWGYLQGSEQNRNAQQWFYFPDGSNVYQQIGQSANNQTLSNIGEDTSSREADNPSRVRLRNHYNTSSSGDDNVDLRTLILCNGDINWDTTGTITTYSLTNIDFLTDHSVPNFTLSEETINLVGTNALFNTDRYLLNLQEDAPVSTTDSASGFRNKTIFKTFSGLNNLVASAGTEGRYVAGNQQVTVFARFYYDDGSNQETSLSYGSGGDYQDYNILNPNPQKTVTQIDISADNASNGDVDLRNPFYITSSFVTGKTVGCSNLKTLDGSETSVLIYGDKITPMGTNIQVYFTDGTNSTIPQSLDVPANISSLGVGDLGVIFIFNTTNNSLTPELIGYGGYII